MNVLEDCWALKPLLGIPLGRPQEAIMTDVLAANATDVLPAGEADNKFMLLALADEALPTYRVWSDSDHNPYYGLRFAT